MTSARKAGQRSDTGGTDSRLPCSIFDATSLGLTSCHGLCPVITSTNSTQAEYTSAGKPYGFSQMISGAM